MQVLGVQFAPLRVPMRRRLQTLAACAWFATFAFGNFAAAALIAALLLYTTYLRWLAVLYLAWCYLDRDVCERGGRRNEWVRGWTWWQYMIDYFPLRLEKTVDLEPTRNYLFCVFPHGVLSTGAFGAFGTSHSRFADLFPGLVPYPFTLRVHFVTPILRELVLSLGALVASREGLAWALGAPGIGRCAVLMVGGASESLYCRPGVYRIILRRRKGFLRLALQNGTPLVPVFSFGETDLYDQAPNPEGSMLRRIQATIQRLTGVAPVVPIGRGFFQYTFGIVPRRAPVTTLVGVPVEVPKIAEPTDEDIEKYHKLFEDSLKALFEENKHKYLRDPEKTFLEIE